MFGQNMKRKTANKFLMRKCYLLFKFVLLVIFVIKRSLIAFKWDEQINTIDELVIEITRHQYTPEYVELTKYFFLKM
jgi:hypothetical protein